MIIFNSTFYLWVIEILPYIQKIVTLCCSPQIILFSQKSNSVSLRAGTSSYKLHFTIHDKGRFFPYCKFFSRIEKLWSYGLDISSKNIFDIVIKFRLPDFQITVYISVYTNVGLLKKTTTKRITYTLSGPHNVIVKCLFCTGFVLVMPSFILWCGVIDVLLSSSVPVLWGYPP